MTRPTFTPPAGIPAEIAARMASKAAASWVCVLADGRAFYLDEARARRMAAQHAGATVLPPDVA